MAISASRLGKCPHTIGHAADHDVTGASGTGQIYDAADRAASSPRDDTPSVAGRVPYGILFQRAPMTERSDISDRNDPQLHGSKPEPVDPKVEILHGRSFAGANIAATEAEQTADARAGTPEDSDIDAHNTPIQVADHGLTE
jgi:hypothetical protein